MALRTGTLFRDFRITVNNKNNLDAFIDKDSAISVSVKVDNSMSSIAILNNSLTNIQSYKYITIDNKNVFEIVGAINNGKWWNLTVEYVSTFEFDDDTSRYISGVSVANLQRLGFSVSDFFAIVGNGTQVAERYVTGAETDKPPFLFAVKLTFSELPKNLSNYMTPNGTAKDAPTGIIYDPTISRVVARNDAMSIPPSDPMAFQQFDERLNVILPIPIITNTDYLWVVYKDNGVTGTVSKFNMAMFIEALDVLITDLTLSVELTVLSQHSIVNVNGTKNSIVNSSFMEFDKNGIRFYYTDFENYNIRYIEGNTQVTTSERKQPCLVMKRTQYSWSGLYEVYDFIRINLPPNEPNEARTNLLFLGNEIDISTMRGDVIFIQRLNSGLRVWLDLLRNNYVDISTPVEFDKNAYSNYVAYKQSNLELTQKQESNALKLTQKQELLRTQSDSLFSGLNTALDIGNSVVSGDYDSAMAGGIGYAISQAQNLVNTGLKQAFAQSNMKLKQVQQRESALRTIVPSSRISGSLAFLNIAKAVGEKSDIMMYGIVSVVLSETQMRKIEKYLIETKTIEPVVDISDIRLPDWQLFRDYALIEFSNFNSLSNQLPAVVYGHLPRARLYTPYDFNIIRETGKDTPMIKITDNKMYVTWDYSPTGMIRFKYKARPTDSFNRILLLISPLSAPNVSANEFINIMVGENTYSFDDDIPYFFGFMGNRETTVMCMSTEFPIPIEDGDYITISMRSDYPPVGEPLNIFGVILYGD